jgi:methionine aminopeptidase
MEKGNVYLLLSTNDTGIETYKIGITKRDISKRISELQTGNESKIELLKSYESIHYRKIEQWLHRKYFKLKTLKKHEWFQLDDEHVFSFINDCKKAEEQFVFLSKTNPFFK